MKEIVDKIKNLRGLEGHKQVSQIQNLQHDKITFLLLNRKEKQINYVLITIL